MYKNTKSTSRSSIARKTSSHKAYLEKIYESSKTIFVERNIVSLKLFGELPTVNPLALISSNKKYLAKIGYLETYINGLPDWFLFHPRIAALIRCLKDAARTNPKVIPFELKLIAFGESPRSMVLAGASNKQPRPNGSAVNQNKKTKPDGVKTPFELAFENAKKLQKINS